MPGLLKEPRTCCDLAFTESVRYAQHRRKVHPKRVSLTCDDCGRTFTESGAFKTHAKSHDVEHRRKLFWRMVNKNGPVPDYAPHLGPCWLWTGKKMSKGYGNFHIPVVSGRPPAVDRRIPRTTINAYQFAYEDLVGPVPKGLELDHLCRVPACVNPAHLEPVTHQENMDRAFAANADRYGCPHCDLRTNNKPALMRHVKFKHPSAPTRSSKTDQSVGGDE